MRASVLARLRAHGLLELASEVARRHRVSVDELEGRALSELGIEMASRGWSDRNIARLLELGQNSTSAPKVNQAPAPPAIVPNPAQARPARPRRKLPPAPPATVVRLVVLPIDELAAAGDRFRCAPLSATLQAGACVHRQEAAIPELRDKLPRSARFALGGIDSYRMCRACPDGRRVASRLGVKLPAIAKRKPAVVPDELEPEEASA